MPKQKKKFIPLPYKQLGKDISKYPFVEIRWVDIEGDDGWSTSIIIRQRQTTCCSI